MMKYGFATFVQARFPIPLMPKRIKPFFKNRDFKPGMEDLWCYVTTTGKVASRCTEQTGTVFFYKYENGLAEVLIDAPGHRSRFALINPDRIFRPEERTRD